MKSFEEIKQRAEKIFLDKEKKVIDFTEGHFKRAINPPHLIVNTTEDNNFGADNIVYQKNSRIQLELTTSEKNIELENKVEKEILYDVFYKKIETYIDSEECYNVSYFFEI